MAEIAWVCQVCERIFHQWNAKICLDCCTKTDVDELYETAPKCNECHANLATVEVENVPYCDLHSPEGLTAMDYLSSGDGEDEEQSGAIKTLRPITNIFFRTIIDLIRGYKEYNIALSKISQWLNKRYHLDSSNQLDSAFLLHIHVYLYTAAIIAMSENDFDGALKILTFLTGPDMAGFYDEDVNISIWKSRCLQHSAEFDDAKKILKNTLEHVVSSAVWAWAEEEDPNDYEPVIPVLFEEIYACARRHKTYLIATELKSAASLVEIKIPEEDYPLLKGISDPIGAGGYAHIGSAKSEAVFEKLQELLRRYESLPKVPTLEELLADSESDTLEFKSSLRWDLRQNKVNKDLEKEVVQTVAAFMNSKGGTLLIGVADDRAVVGIEEDLRSFKHGTDERFQRHLCQILHNYLGQEFCSQCVAVSLPPHVGKTVCRVSVSPSPKPVHLKQSKEFYVRSGNRTEQLDIEEAVRYIEMHWTR